MRKSFFDLFPPPRYLETPYVGLDISDDALRFVEFEHNYGRLRLKRHGEKLLPKGLVTAGYVNNSQALGKILGDLQKEFHLKYVSTALPDEKTYMFDTDVTRGDESVMRESIEFKIEDNVPIPIAEAIFDYNLLPDNSKSDTVPVVVSVAPEQVARAYTDVLAMGGLTPIVLEVESRSIARAVIEKDDMRAYLVINIEKDKTGLYIVCDGVVRFTSVVLNTIDTKRVIPALAKEIEKIFDYWETHKPSAGQSSKKIEKIIVCGGTLPDAQNVELLEPILKTKVAVGNVWVNAFSLDQSIPDISYSDSLRFANAVGLALPMS